MRHAICNYLMLICLKTFFRSQNSIIFQILGKMRILRFAQKCPYCSRNNLKSVNIHIDDVHKCKICNNWSESVKVILLWLFTHNSLDPDPSSYICFLSKDFLSFLFLFVFLVHEFDYYLIHILHQNIWSIRKCVKCSGFSIIYYLR